MTTPTNSTTSDEIEQTLGEWFLASVAGKEEHRDLVEHNLAIIRENIQALNAQLHRHELLLNAFDVGGPENLTREIFVLTPKLAGSIQPEPPQTRPR
jgi:hypothetical protein